MEKENLIGREYILPKTDIDMVSMGMELYENTMRRFALYQDIEISEKETEKGQIKDAGTALAQMKAYRTRQ